MRRGQVGDTGRDGDGVGTGLGRGNKDAGRELGARQGWGERALLGEREQAALGKGRHNKAHDRLCWGSSVGPGRGWGSEPSCGGVQGEAEPCCALPDPPLLSQGQPPDGCKYWRSQRSLGPQLERGTPWRPWGWQGIGGEPGFTASTGWPGACALQGFSGLISISHHKKNVIAAVSTLENFSL